MKTTRTRNEGFPRRELKEIEVSGVTVDPTAEVEIPDAGLNVESLDLENFDAFRIFGADNDEQLILTDSFPVGGKITLINTDAFEIALAASLAYDVNGASSGAVTIGSGILLVELFRPNTDNMILKTITPAGVEANPVPA
jgi:hypothetical protein